MGSSIEQAKVRPVSWDAFEKVEPFTEGQETADDHEGAAAVLPKTPLPEATLDRVIMCIWCVCYCGMQWRAACKLADLPFGTVYSCFARWRRLGLWKALLLDLLRSWRLACGDNPAPSVVVVPFVPLGADLRHRRRQEGQGRQDQPRGRQARLRVGGQHLQGQRS